jgi:ribosomal-protein-alanine N-acetyltransferase
MSGAGGILEQTQLVMRTARLELIAATLEFVAADLHQRELLPTMFNAQIGDGWPAPLIDVPVMLRLKQSLVDEPEHNGWTAWYWILGSPRTLIGMSGFKNKPADGAVEIGYSLLPQFQRRGFATEAVAAMVNWAFAHGAQCVFAETLPELFGSQRVLIRNGFVRTSVSSEPGVFRFERRR